MASVVISNPNSPNGMFTYEEAQANAHLFMAGTYVYHPSLGGYVPASDPARIIDPGMLGGAAAAPQSQSVPARQRHVRRIGFIAE